MKKQYWILSAVLLSLFLLHTIIGIRIAENHRSFYLHNDGSEYLELAESIAKDNTLTSPVNRYYEAKRDTPAPEAYRAPLLPFLGGIALKIYAGIASTAILMALISTLLSATIFLLTLRLSGSERAAYLALFLASLHPLVTQYSFQFCSETLFSLFLMLYALAWLSPNKPRKYVLMGLAGAMATLVRPTALLLLPLTGFVLLLPSLLENLKRKKFCSCLENYKNAGIFILVFFLVLLPFGIRNQYHFGHFTLTSFLGGYNLFVGNNTDNLNAYRHMNNGREFVRFQTLGWDRAIALIKNLPEEYSGDPAHQDRYMQQKALEEIQKMGIGNFLYLLTAKAWHFIRPWPMYGIHSPLVFWGTTLFELFLYGAGIAGIYLERKNWRKMLPFLLILLCGWSAHILVHVYTRYKIPFVDVSLIIFAGIGLNAFLNCFFRTKRNIDDDVSQNSRQASTNIEQ